MTTVINIKSGAHYDQYCGRAGRGQDGYFGNPFRLPIGEARGATLDKYREYFYDRLVSDDEFRRRVLELKDKTLGCFCKPYDCHCDIIAEYLDCHGAIPSTNKSYIQRMDDVRGILG